MTERTTEHWRHVESLFHEALDLPEPQRSVFLDQVNREQSKAISDDLAQLLGGRDEDSIFLESPAVPGGFALSDTEEEAPNVELPLPERIGDYRILELLGEGGMGLVYLAEQEFPKRTVALKIIKPGIATSTMLRRFQAEADILGRLQHPGIAHIYEAGAAVVNGAELPFFAMERIDGTPITDFVQDRQLPLQERLELLARVCDAVQHAHQQGVIHRDLKPSNILVTSDSVPRVLDFGVARLTQDDGGSSSTRQTSESELIGTLPYMSPEQLTGDPLDIDTRSDIYALGIIGYEMISGSRPHQLHDTTLPEAIRIVTEAEPRSLGSLDRRLRGDVETIISTALAREKDRRFATAAELAADLRRFLRHEPITARPASTTYQLRKFARRNRTLVAGTAAVLLAMITGLATTLWQAGRAEEQAGRAEQKAGLAEAHARRADLQTEIAEEEARRADDRANQVAAINDFLKDILLLANDPSGGFDPRLVDMLIDAEEQIDEAFADRPLAEADVRETLGDAFFRLARPGDARRQYDRSYSLRLAHLGVDDPGTIGAQSGLASCDIAEGHSQIARERLIDIIERRTRILGPHHHKTLGSRHDLAMALYQLQETTSAEQLFNEVYSLQREHLGEAERDTLVTRLNLVNLMVSEGRYEEAEPVCRNAVDTYLMRHGENDPDALKAIGVLARLLRRLDRDEEAEPLYERYVEGFRRVVGNEHAGTLTAMYNYGTFLWSKGDREKAITVFFEAASYAESGLTDRNSLTGSIRARLGDYLMREDRYDESEQQLLAAFNGLRAEFGPTHQQTQRVVGQLIKLYDRMEQTSDADEFRSMLMEDSDQ